MTTAMTVGTIDSKAVVVNNNFSEKWVAEWLEFNADKSAATVATYGKAIGNFLKWRAENGIEEPQRSDIIGYRDWLVGTKKPATARLYLVAVKNLFRWLASQGLYRNVCDNIKTPSLAEAGEVHGREALTLDEARQVLSSFKGKTSEKDLRDALIMRIMLNCGLRSIEIIRLDANDIEKRHGKIFLKVWGKGRAGRSAHVEISKTIYGMILDYLNARGSKREKGEPMFTSTARRNFGQRLQTQTVSRLAKATLRSVGIDSETVTCHSCRHFTATQLLLEGVDISRVSKLLRHKSVSVTETYRHDISAANDNCVGILSDLLDAA